MLGGLTSLRNYLAISAVVAAAIFLIQLVLGKTLADGLTSFNASARSAGVAQVIADAITEPIKAVIMPNNPIGAIAGGLLWPLLGTWILLLFVLFFFAVISRGLGTAGRAIST